MFNSSGVPFLRNKMIQAFYVFALIYHTPAMELRHQVLQQRQVVDSPGMLARMVMSQSSGNGQEKRLVNSLSLGLESLKIQLIQGQGKGLGLRSQGAAAKETPTTPERGSSERAVDMISSGLLLPSEAAVDAAAAAAETRPSAKLRSAQPEAASGLALFPIINPGRALLALFAQQAPLAGDAVKGRHVSWVRVGLVQQETVVSQGRGYAEKAQGVKISPTRRRRFSEEQAEDRSEGRTLLTSGPEPVQGGRGGGAADIGEIGGERGDAVPGSSPYDNSTVLVETASVGEAEEASGAPTGGRGDNARSGSQRDAGNPLGAVPDPSHLTTQEGQSGSRRDAGNPHGAVPEPPRSTTQEGQDNNPWENQFLKRAFLDKDFVGTAPANMNRLQHERNFLQDQDQRASGNLQGSGGDAFPKVPGLDPKDNPAFDPKLNPALDPKNNPSMDPNNPAFDPNKNPALDPNKNPALDPNLKVNGATPFSRPVAGVCLLAATFAVLQSSTFLGAVFF